MLKVSKKSGAALFYAVLFCFFTGVFLLGCNAPLEKAAEEVRTEASEEATKEVKEQTPGETPTETIEEVTSKSRTRERARDQERVRAENIGWVTSVTGNASLMHFPELEGASVAIPIAEGDEVFLNDTIETGRDSTVVIQFDDDSVLSLGGGTKILVTEWVYDKEQRSNQSSFKLFGGQVRGLLNSLFDSGSSMSFETPTAIAGVKGSDITVWVEGDETFAAVTEGEGFLRSLDKRQPGTVRIKAGYMARHIKARALGKASRISDKTKNKIKKLKVERKSKFIKKLKEKRKQRIKDKKIKKQKLKKEKIKKKIKDKKSKRERNR